MYLLWTSEAPDNPHRAHDELNWDLGRSCVGYFRVTVYSHDKEKTERCHGPVLGDPRTRHAICSQGPRLGEWVTEIYTFWLCSVLSVLVVSLTPITISLALMQLSYRHFVHIARNTTKMCG